MEKTDRIDAKRPFQIGCKKSRPPIRLEVREWNSKQYSPSVDLVTKEKFKDFKLHAEFRIPKRGNSGIYLRGRYEVQISDDQGREVANNRSTGSIYGFLAPNQNVTKPAGEWNIFDIILNGRWITIEFNGHKVIDKAEIPGITGGALDCQEGEPGPIMLQGDHQAVEYRNIVITPAK